MHAEHISKLLARHVKTRAMIEPVSSEAVRAWLEEETKKRRKNFRDGGEGRPTLAFISRNPKNHNGLVECTFDLAALMKTEEESGQLGSFLPKFLQGAGALASVYSVEAWVVQRTRSGEKKKEVFMVSAETPSNNQVQLFPIRRLAGERIRLQRKPIEVEPEDLDLSLERYGWFVGMLLPRVPPAKGIN